MKKKQVKQKSTTLDLSTEGIPSKKISQEAIKLIEEIGINDALKYFGEEIKIDVDSYLLGCFKRHGRDSDIINHFLDLQRKIAAHTKTEIKREKKDQVREWMKTMKSEECRLKALTELGIKDRTYLNYIHEINEEKNARIRNAKPKILRKT